MLLPPFIQKRNNYKERLDNNLNSAEYRLLDRITDVMFKTKQGRMTCTGEFSVRYLMNFVKLSFSYISKLLKRLIAKGFLEIIKRGSSGYGSIYRVIIREEEIIPLQSNKIRCVLQETSTNNYINNDYHDFSKEFNKAMNIAKNILRKKNIKEPEPILNRIREFINLQGGKILNPAGYLIGAVKREPEVKPEPKHYLTAEETVRRLDRQEQSDPIIRVKTEPEELQLGNTLPGDSQGAGQEEQEEKRNYLEELELIKASYPEKIKETEKALHREIGIIWNYTEKTEKARKIIDRFIQENS